MCGTIEDDVSPLYDLIEEVWIANITAKKLHRTPDFGQRSKPFAEVRLSDIDRQQVGLALANAMPDEVTAQESEPAEHKNLVNSEEHSEIVKALRAHLARIESLAVAAKR